MHALRVLEFEAIVERLAQQCETTPGRAQALQIQPSFDPELVPILLQQTGEAATLLETGGMSLRGLRDVSQPLILAEKEGVCDGESLFFIGESLRIAREAKSTLNGRSANLPRLHRLSDRLMAIPDLEAKLQSSLESDGTVKSEASPGLAAARGKKSSFQQRIQEAINRYITGKTREWLSDAVVSQRSGRFVIPLRADHRGKIKGIVHDTSMSGATIYIEPDDVVQLGNQLREAESQERAEVEKVLRRLSNLAGAKAELIRTNLDALTELDLILAKGRLGLAMKACLPDILPRPGISLKEARHPLLDRESCVPLTISLNDDHPALIITGPNTGGKTVAMKTVGLAAAMAQCGMMVGAESAKVGVFSQFWADIGDEQSLHQSLSTFSAHIKNIAEAIRGLRKGALVLLDEVGAGTDPDEGAALARALLLEFRNGGALILASSHYGELKVFASEQPGFLNCSMEFDRKSLRPTYRFMMGLPGSSHALAIAQRHGIPPRVIEQAKQAESESERDLAAMIQSLETSQRLAQSSQARADKLAGRLAKVEAEAEEKIAKLEESRQKLRGQAAEELNDLLRQIRLEAQEVFESIKRDPSQKGIEAARAKLKSLQDVGQEFVEEMKPKAPPKPAKTQRPNLKKGDSVRISGFEQMGQLMEEPKNGRVAVLVGSMRLTVKEDQLTPVQTAAKAMRSTVRQVVQEKSDSTRSEIHLRNMRAEDAQEVLDKFLDDAVLSGLPYLRIVHGKGDGILRSITQETLKRHKAIKSFREGDSQEGGSGVTIASMEAR